MLFVPGLGTVQLAPVSPGLHEVRERVAREHHQVPAAGNEPLELFAFFAAGILAVTDPQMCGIVVENIRFAIVIRVNTVVYLITFGVQPRCNELIPGVESAHDVRL